MCSLKGCALLNRGLTDPRAPMRKAMFIISSAFIVGCSSTPPRQGNESGAHGDFPKNYSEIVKSYYRPLAEEPNSIRFNVIHAPRIYSISNKLRQEKYGYLVCADLNLKKSNGEYTGHHTDGLLINNGRIVHFIERGEWFGKNVCQEALNNSP